MKICVVSTPVFKCPPPGYSGLEMICWQQARGLAAKGHEVSLVAPEGSECPNVTIISNGPAGTWDERRAYERYWEELLKFDVVLDSSWHKWSFILKTEGRLKAPVLAWMHAPVNTMYQTLPPVEKPCFVCISKDQANHFEAIHGNVETRVCHNGIDLNHYRALDIPRSDRYLFLARFSSVKSPDIALRVCTECDVGLDLIGDTSITNEPDYFRQCMQMTDGKKRRIVGSVSRGNSVWWYSQAFAFISPTKNFREPFGLAPVEAMACGLPVLGWRFGALQETIVDGETGFLVRSEQEMIKLIKSGSLLRIKREACREQASKFTEEKMISRCEELCIEAVEGGGW